MRARFAALGPAYKALIGLVAPVATIITTLLALGVIDKSGSDALAAGAGKTSEAGTAHVDLEFTGGAQGAAKRAFEAHGAYDYRARRGQLRYDFSATPGAEQLTDIAVVFAGRQAYVQRAKGDWVHVDLGTARETLTEAAAANPGIRSQGDVAALGDLDLNDPSQVLSYLRKHSGAKQIGEENVFGTATKVYRGTVDADGGPVAVTAWVGDDDLIRRLTVEGEPGDAPFALTMELSRFGEPVRVRVPARGDVTELADLLARG
jgi:hypothetical protein